MEWLKLEGMLSIRTAPRAKPAQSPNRVSFFCADASLGFPHGIGSPGVWRCVRLPDLALNATAVALHRRRPSSDRTRGSPRGSGHERHAALGHNPPLA